MFYPNFVGSHRNCCMLSSLAAATACPRGHRWLASCRACSPCMATCSVMLCSVASWLPMPPLARLLAGQRACCPRFIHALQCTLPWLSWSPLRWDRTRATSLYVSRLLRRALLRVAGRRFGFACIGFGYSMRYAFHRVWLVILFLSGVPSQGSGRPHDVALLSRGSHVAKQRTYGELAL